MANRILSGHTYCGQILNKMGVKNSAGCDVCGVIEDSSHIIFSCRKYSIPRSKFPKIEEYDKLFDFLQTEGMQKIFYLTDFLDSIDTVL